MMQKKMKDLDMKETSSKSLLTNVLDMDDDFRTTTLPHNFFSQHPSHVTPSQNNSGILRCVCIHFCCQYLETISKPRKSI